ncbi:hypothetical protein BDP55DRAFT_678670 [Colletotrichum godetiae]|uniref:Uncharacterized protein n=1 Tax=Colletotrichum godetiae TaxID=1209918 RepID=A0AAJ0AC82_9PEZI|nr:uncharacterized protein BDP55DRAFT_678670 [Colletotrichum godetiae]KAK1659843.1 hypothetical protein BDP55DRAFT_678670 [Colletotrichum godetiae]
MCNYTQRELHCGHTRYIVSEWCPVYANTQRRCPLFITHFEYRNEEVCGECKPSTPVVWEPMINRNPNSYQSTFCATIGDDGKAP